MNLARAVPGVNTDSSILLHWSFAMHFAIKAVCSGHLDMRALRMKKKGHLPLRPVGEKNKIDF